VILKAWRRRKKKEMCQMFLGTINLDHQFLKAVAQSTIQHANWGSIATSEMVHYWTKTVKDEF